MRRYHRELVVQTDDGRSYFLDPNTGLPSWTDASSSSPPSSDDGPIARQIALAAPADSRGRCTSAALA